MYICTIGNQKGGVGKTTTTHNLGVFLARKGKRVLLVDLDAQGNLSDACGLEPQKIERTVFDVLSSALSIAEARRPLEDKLDLLPANSGLRKRRWPLPVAWAGRTS